MVAQLCSKICGVSRRHKDRGAPMLFEHGKRLISANTDTRPSLCQACCSEESDDDLLVSQSFKRVPSMNAQSFPMYVLPLTTVLSFDRVRPHQDLMARGLLKTLTPEMLGRIIFVSHQWLAWEHPDPHGEQFAYFQKVIRGLMRNEYGSISAVWKEVLAFGQVRTTPGEDFAKALPHMFVWYDYWSIPQQGYHGFDMSHYFNAVTSIPFYLEQTALVIVLAPPCRHLDTGEICSYKTWLRRGWCRLEAVCALLARDDIPVLVCDGRQPMYSYTYDAYNRIPGDGDFSCCARGHFIDGKQIQCDKERITSALKIMLEGKIRHLRQQDDITASRFFTSMQNVFLAGLDDVTNAVHVGDGSTRLDVDDYLLWGSEEPEPSNGWTKLFFACNIGNADAVAALLCSKANVNSSLKENWPRLGVSRNATPLSRAMLCCSWDIVRMLLDARADTRAPCDEVMQDALGVAAYFGKEDNVKAWLAHFPNYDVNARTAHLLGTTPTLVCVEACFGKYEGVLRALFEAKADVNRTSCNLGSSLLIGACNTENAQLEVVQFLLEARANVNHQMFPVTTPAKLLGWAARIRVACGTSCSFWRNCAQWEGSTALHWAAQHGHPDIVQKLITCKADVGLRNARGHTAVEVVQKEHKGHVSDLLEEAFENQFQAQEEQCFSIRYWLHILSSLFQTPRPNHLTRFLRRPIEQKISSLQDFFLVSTACLPRFLRDNRA